MLIECKECGHDVSDQAIACPNCGFPIKKEKYQRRSSKRRMRLPNGFGQISEIKGRNLRNPWRAMVTVGKDENGRPICKPLQPRAYFPTYNDAYQALSLRAENNRDAAKIVTMKTMREAWLEKYKRSGVTEESIRKLDYAWKFCSSIHSMKVSEIRQSHIRKCLYDSVATTDNGTYQLTPTSQLTIKWLLDMLFDYAVEYEYTDQNYSRLVKLSKEVGQELRKNKKPHLSFTEEELDLLWKHSNDDRIQNILIQCYTGWRPGELMDLKLENIDLEVGIMIGGGKTEAGKNRIVPIHDAIRPFIEQRINQSNEYLIENNGRKFSYNSYKRHFDKVIDELNMNARHRPHDGRKTFVTLAKRYRLDEYAIKHIAGHAIADITENVYTDRDTAWLISEMQKIKAPEISTN